MLDVGKGKENVEWPCLKIETWIPAHEPTLSQSRRRHHDSPPAIEHHGITAIQALVLPHLIMLLLSLTYRLHSSFIRLRNSLGRTLGNSNIIMKSFVTGSLLANFQIRLVSVSLR